MNDNVVKYFPGNAAEDPDLVLEQAIGEFQNVLILGYDKDGNFEFRADLGLKDGGDVLWLIENFKHKLLSGDFAN